MKTTALIIAGLIFALVSLIHLFRVFFHFDVVIAGYEVPYCFNIVGFFVTGILSYFMFRSALSE